jgi:hypothetical protein
VQCGAARLIKLLSSTGFRSLLLPLRRPVPTQRVRSGCVQGLQLTSGRWTARTCAGDVGSLPVAVVTCSDRRAPCRRARCCPCCRLQHCSLSHLPRHCSSVSKSAGCTEMCARVELPPPRTPNDLAAGLARPLLPSSVRSVTPCATPTSRAQPPYWREFSS